MGKKIKIFIVQYNGEGWAKREIEAKKVKIKGWEDIPMAVHPQYNSKGEEQNVWAVTDIRNGAAIGFGQTKLDALIHAEIRLRSVTHAEYSSMAERILKDININDLPKF